MRCVNRNKQKIYYANLIGDTEITTPYGMYTGERALTYGTPTEIYINVSPARGEILESVFGLEENYSLTLVTSDTECPITNGTVLWIGVPSTGNPNYRVTRIARSLNSIVYALQEVANP